MTSRTVEGPFDVQTTAGAGPAASLGRFTLEKRYHGELEGIAKGEMLSAGDPRSGNAGYVAIEEITGTLEGKRGTFALMQLGTMAQGSPPQLTLSIVPGSGTGELAGIQGTASIRQDGGQHRYAITYTL